jgi:hypothetical protein
VLHIEAQMRKQRKEEVYRKAELKRALIEWTVGILLVLSGIIGLAIGISWVEVRGSGNVVLSVVHVYK